MIGTHPDLVESARRKESYLKQTKVRASASYCTTKKITSSVNATVEEETHFEANNVKIPIVQKEKLRHKQITSYADAVKHSVPSVHKKSNEVRTSSSNSYTEAASCQSQTIRAKLDQRMKTQNRAIAVEKKGKQRKSYCNGYGKSSEYHHRSYQSISASKAKKSPVADYPRNSCRASKVRSGDDERSNQFQDPGKVFRSQVCHQVSCSRVDNGWLVAVGRSGSGCVPPQKRCTQQVCLRRITATPTPPMFQN